MLLNDLQLVTIELKAAENSQEIFETLNARGTPLTAADLIRNFVFQRLEAEGGDLKKAYHDDWPFESKFWTKEVSVGRYFMSPQFAVLQPVAGIPHWRGRQHAVDLLPVQVIRRARGREADGGPARRHRCTGRSV